MGTYKNNYTKNEDETLWELHEIRYKLHKDSKNKSIEEINREALKKYQSWQKQKNEVLSAG